ncbi:MAG: YafY family transcriptional regulator [Desulfomonile tiedjei]|uniref:YafY family transcriptional regulator n=1 Tax=Desulfomonile tiedjei TaxID=2358 RepID=A0A9D6UZV7_9BACT|nr:YafY family transcriptional regulator [Desulfomonile tiedjei]
MRGTILARQWRIIKMMESRKMGITGIELAHELEAPLRTVYRDLEAIQEAGFPIYNEKVGKNSYWKLVDRFKKDLPLPLTATELMALHMSRDLLSIFEGTIFHESIESLFDKVKAVLSPETLRYLENISGRLKIGFASCKDLTSCKEAIQGISKATATKKRVEILYKAVSTGRQTVRKVDPYQVWAMNGGVYLIGLCHLRNAVRTFAMDRIGNYKVLDEPFHFPKDFNLEDYLQTAFNVMRGEPRKIRIRFAPGAAHVVRERIWHPTQEIRELGDGGVEIFLEVPINYEITSWILGFGAAATVIEPDSLRSRIRDEHQAAAACYEKPVPASEAFTKKI